jgi:hypothetical protein
MSLDKRVSINHIEKTPEEKAGNKAKERAYMAMLVSLGANATIYLNVSGLLPPYIKVNHPSLEGTLYTLMLNMFQITYIFTSPMVALNLKKIGRKNSVIFGYTMMTIAILGFSMITFIPAGMDTEYLLAGMLFRGM